MYRKPLAIGVLSLAAVAMTTGCVDDKYDLSDIDTTTRLTVDNLTVPLNVSTIHLKDVIDLDDNDNIEKIEIAPGDTVYAIVKGGKIEPTEFSLQTVHVNEPEIMGSKFHINLPSIPNIPGVTVDIPEQIIKLPDQPLQDYKFNLKVDQALRKLYNVKSQEPIEIKVVLKVPSSLIGTNNKVSFQNIHLTLPWGLITDNKDYNIKDGKIVIDEIPVAQDGTAIFSFKATGLDMLGTGTVENEELNIKGKVGIDEAKIVVKFNEISNIPSTADITADYYVSAFDLATFSGSVKYTMDDIKIDPIELTGLPDFLDDKETNLVIANPQILVSLNNPVSKYGLEGTGTIGLSSVFNNGDTIKNESALFTLTGDETKLAFCTPAETYDSVGFEGLKYVLSAEYKEGKEIEFVNDGLPKEIQVNIHDIIFESDTVKNFPLGNIGSASGDYEFKAPLGFGVGTKVVYETTEDGWSDDTLDDVNITKIHLKANCTTNLPVGIQLSVYPVEKIDGKTHIIPVTEDSGKFEVPAKAKNEPIELYIEGKNGPIKNLDGIEFRAIVEQNNENNTNALGPNLEITLDDLRITVDGYYETDF